MKQEQSNMYASGRGSNPSGGISAFRGGASTDGMLDHGVPMIADSNSEAIQSVGAAGVGEDLQQMYDRVMGAEG